MLRQVTVEATIAALLYDVKSPLPAPREEVRQLVQAVRRLVCNGRGESSSVLPNRPLESIFTHLNGEHPKRFLPMLVQDGSLHMPEPSAEQTRPETYHNQMEALRAKLAERQWDAEGIPGLLRLLEDYLCFVPASYGEGDISLYDYAKITAAIASCAAAYLADKEKANGYRLTELATDFRQEAAFLLYSADFSGIQKFIFAVATKGALPSLRSRSFFLELLMEHYIDELLAACGVSRANLLYSGGGHCYLLLPHTPAVEKVLEQWNTQFNNWLTGQFAIQLFIAHGWSACSGNDITNVPATEAPYTAMFRRVSAAIAFHKLHRYTPAQLRALNEASANPDGRECIVCGKSEQLSDTGRCTWCEQFVALSRKILESSVYLVSRQNTDCDFVLPGWEGERYVSLTNEKTACTRLQSGEAVVRLYTKNQAYPALPNATRLYVGDYAASRQMADLASDAQGITRLAVCRMDVDNLGQAFVAGYRKTDQTDMSNRDTYVNISRTSAFSRQMSLFFKSYINTILSRPEPDGHLLSVAVVYSGGDDVFLVGAWNDVIASALRIQSNFDTFCGGALTISAGISLHDDHFPIRLAAAQSAALEDCAKQTPGKNAVCLFAPEAAYTYSWQVFRDKVLGEKKRALQAFFHSEEQERGNAFLYQLLELLRASGVEQIHIARYAYLLARMEPKDKKKKEIYKTFSASMYRWALQEQNRKELITAIYLYLYAERKAN